MTHHSPVPRVRDPHTHTHQQDQRDSVTCSEQPRGSAPLCHSLTQGACEAPACDALSRGALRRRKRMSRRWASSGVTPSAVSGVA